METTNDQINMLLFFGIIGVIASTLLTGIDFFTSYIGIEALLPKGVASSSSIIFSIIPLIFALLALAFNGLTAYFFDKLRRKIDASTVNLVLLSITWLFFLVYDITTSFIGIIAGFGENESIIQLYKSLPREQAMFAIVMAILASMGPFFVCFFMKIVQEQRKKMENS